MPKARDWRVEAARRREAHERLRAWAADVYALAPAARPFGQRGQYPKPPYPKAEDGSHLCRWCGVSLAGKQRSRWWCGKDCVHEFRIRADWNYIRAAIIKRDTVCKICGGASYDQSRHHVHIYYDDDAFLTWEQYHQVDRDERRELNRVCKLVADWDVDHIVAVADGGTDAPENLRLLCGRCHATVTAGQHQRWALERRAAEPQMALLPP